MIRKYNIRLGLVIALICALIGVAVQVRAQDAAKTVTYDTPVEGKVDDANPSQTWELTAPGKDKISITVQRTDGTLVPTLTLLDANNQSINADNAYDSGDVAYLERFNLPAAGKYQVVVGRYSDKDGKTTGSYKLSVSLDSAGEDNPAVANVAPQPVTYDKPVEGELTNGAWRNVWTFDATGADNLHITVTRTSGTLRPAFEVFDSNNTSISQGFVDYTGSIADVDRVSLKGPGKYTLVVSRDRGFNGGTIGKYSLSVALVGAGMDRAELLTPVGPAKIDGVTTGEITSTKWSNVYTFETQSADRMRFTVTRTDGNLIPRLVVLGANNQQLTTAYPDETYASADVTYNLPGPGKYAVQVLRDGDDKGLTSGKYELAISLIGIGEENPIFKTVAGNITLGTPVKGVLNGAKWQDSWTFDAAENANITITIKRTSGNLIPTGVLVGPNSANLTTLYPDDTYAQATVQSYTVPSAGKYTIIVKRQSDQTGITTGAYELLVDVVKQ